MTLADVIATVQDREKTLNIYNTDSAVVADIMSGLADRNVTVSAETTATGHPEEAAILCDDEEVIAVAGVESLQDATKRAADKREGRYPRSRFPTPKQLRHERERSGDPQTPGEELLDAISDRTFTSYDTRQMIYLSREIEDRAWRVGTGRIHSGFQRVDAITDQRRKYRRLAKRGLDVHVYAGEPEATPPNINGVTAHLEGTSELASTWFVVFDGGQDPLQKSALLADRREGDSYYGVVTYEPQLVDRVLEYLTHRYQSSGTAPEQPS